MLVPVNLTDRFGSESQRGCGVDPKTSISRLILSPNTQKRKAVRQIFPETQRNQSSVIEEKGAVSFAKDLSHSFSPSNGHFKDEVGPIDNSPDSEQFPRPREFESCQDGTSDKDIVLPDSFPLLNCARCSSPGPRRSRTREHFKTGPNRSAPLRRTLARMSSEMRMQRKCCQVHKWNVLQPQSPFTS